MTRSFAVALVFLEVRVIGGVTGLESLDVHANETIVWACLAFSILSADLVLQWQQLGSSPSVVGAKQLTRKPLVTVTGLGLLVNLVMKLSQMKRTAVCLTLFTCLGLATSA